MGEIMNSKHNIILILLAIGTVIAGFYSGHLIGSSLDNLLNENRTTLASQNVKN